MSALGTSQDSGCDSMPNSGAIVSKHSGKFISVYNEGIHIYIYGGKFSVTVCVTINTTLLHNIA